MILSLILSLNLSALDAALHRLWYNSWLSL